MRTRMVAKALCGLAAGLLSITAAAGGGVQLEPTAAKAPGLGADALALPAIQDSASLAWGADKFCKAQKAGTCVADKPPEQFAVLNGAWIALFRDGARVAASPDSRVEDWARSGNWDIGCSRDKMTSQRSCYITKGALFIRVKPNGKTALAVGDDNFPGSQTSIKIGQKRFDTMERDGFFENAGHLAGLMRNGTPVVTRYMKWPDRHWIDDEFTVYGLDTAVQVARWLVKNGDFH